MGFFCIKKKIFLLCFLLLGGIFLFPKVGLAAGEFITTWKTDNVGVSANNQITLPTTGDGYNFDVDWGDASSTVGVTTTITHSYAIAGTYTVTVSGTFPRIYFNNGGDKLKILSVEQWGTTQWDYMNSAFKGAANLVINAVDAPDLSNVTDTGSMFEGATSMNNDISAWDMSHVTSIAAMFYGATSFNQDIGGWDVSRVTDMGSLFGGATNFNQDISAWDVGNVTSMYDVFDGATNFNQDIGGWDVSSVTNMAYMFRDASSFDQDISAWDVSNVTTMISMFNGASAFDQPLNTWDVSSVTDMNTMFYNTTFNQPLNNWDVSSVTNMSAMFDETDFFNQDIGSWDVSNVTDFSYMFYNADAFNQDIGSWDVSSATNMSVMFSEMLLFNQDLSSWDVSNVTLFTTMFANAVAFNQPLDSWDVSSATNMASMFRGATNFNQPLGSWDVSNVTNFGFMFNNAFDFDQDLSSWDVSASPNMFAMFSDAGLSTENYDALLRAWSALPLQSNVTFHANGIKYCSSVQRSSIVSTYNWTITDAGVDDCHTLSYNVTTGGSISGEATQSILDAANGRSVTAVPDHKHIFVSWSDGSTQNPRTDTNITEDLGLTAIFKPRPAGTVFFACRDPQAINFQNSGVSKSSLCKYPTLLDIPVPSAATTTSPSPLSILPVEPVEKVSCRQSLFPTAPIGVSGPNDTEQVKLLEQFLNTYEHTNLSLDGVYSLEDQKAVVFWQEKYAAAVLAPWGLTSGTGNIFTTSLAEIKKQFFGQCMQDVAHPPQPVFSLSSFVRDLQFGMSGADVRALQNILIKGSGPAAFALAKIGPTGYFGFVTQEALIEFQTFHQIVPAHGYFGSVTRSLFIN